MKPTVALLDVTGPQGETLARNLALRGYRIILALRDTKEAERILAVIRRETGGAQVDRLDCVREASWEADIILSMIHPKALNEICAHVREVVTCKLVVSFSKGSADQLAQLLPHSSIVEVEGMECWIGFAGRHAVKGCSPDAVSVTRDLLVEAGYLVQHNNERAV